MLQCFLNCDEFSNREFSIFNRKLDIFVTSNIDSLIQMFDVN